MRFIRGGDRKTVNAGNAYDVRRQSVLINACWSTSIIPSAQILVTYTLACIAWKRDKIEYVPIVTEYQDERSSQHCKLRRRPRKTYQCLPLGHLTSYCRGANARHVWTSSGAGRV